MIPWFKNVVPHQDIKDGVLDESVFAADLADVSEGSGRAVYREAGMFFAKTYFTVGLRTICKRVVDGLNGKTDSGDRVVSLQTGFGGGKTHSLITLYHVAKQGNALSEIAEVQEEGRTTSEETTIQTAKQFKTLRITGKVALENWPQILQSFLLPLKDNRVSVNIEITAKATDATPISENTQNYKITKESASQLGLDFRTEE